MSPEATHAKPIASHRQTSRFASMGPALPGALILFVFWLILIRATDFSGSAERLIATSGHSLGIGILTTEPLGSLINLHIQPPLMNALWAMDLFVSPSSHWFLAALWLACALSTVFLIVDTLRRVGVTASWSCLAGVVYALLPGTVAYSLWPFTPTLCASLTILAVWGIALNRSRPLAGITVSATAMLLLAITRTSFVWPFLLLWTLALLLFLMRSSKVRKRLMLIIAAAIATIGMGIQVHYFTSFGLPTMSSWAGENLAKALKQSGALNVTPRALEFVRQDPCQAQLLEAFVDNQVEPWDQIGFRTLPACATIPHPIATGSPALDSATKIGMQAPNYNYSDRIVASSKWTQVMSAVIRGDPFQLTRMAFAPPAGPPVSSIRYYLARSEHYELVTPLQDVFPPTKVLTILSYLFAPILWLLLILGCLQAATKHGSWLRARPEYWFAFGILSVHLAVSSLFEYGENMRFRAEIDSVLLVAGVMALFSLTRRPLR